LKEETGIEKTGSWGMNWGGEEERWGEGAAHGVVIGGGNWGVEKYWKVEGDEGGRGLRG